MKQVIVVRKDLNMRKGKMIAQGSHASLIAYLAASKSGNFMHEVWLQEGQTKICVGVDSLEELQKIYQEAVEQEIPCSLVLDAAHTEFKEPTYTAVCLGPYYEDDINKITGHLKLL